MDWLYDLWNRSFLETVFPFLDPLFGLLIVGNAVFWGGFFAYETIKRRVGRS